MENNLSLQMFLQLCFWLSLTFFCLQKLVQISAKLNLLNFPQLFSVHMKALTFNLCSFGLTILMTIFKWPYFCLLLKTSRRWFWRAETGTVGLHFAIRKPRSALSGHVTFQASPISDLKWTHTGHFSCKDKRLQRKSVQVSGQWEKGFPSLFLLQRFPRANVLL